MARHRRLLLLLLPLSLVCLAQAPPGRAQQAAPSARFAFADTTLLRDTLALHFTGLFPLADSLQITPDTLRALMIRYRYTMPRLLHLSDSLNVVVDSVGPLMEREKFNPLAGGAGRSASSFAYTSGYDISRTSSTWTNGSTYRMQHGALYVTNATNIELQRITSGRTLSLRQNREATTEAGMTVSRRLSFGGRSYQLRFFSGDPGGATQNETKNEYSFTGRGATNTRAVTSELNLRSGYLDDRNVNALKRGLSGSADGRVRYNVPGQFSHDLSGSVTGNLSHTRPPESLQELNTTDLSTSLRGNLAVKTGAPVSLNLNYALRNTRVETPLSYFRTDTVHTATDTTYTTVTLGAINRIITKNNSVDAAVRLRADNDRYVNLTGNAGRSGSATGTRADAGGHATLRWLMAGIAIDGNYGDTRESSVYFRQRGGGGYDEHGISRAADTQMLRTFGAKVVGKLISSITLDRYRYEARADSATPPSPRDSYRQSYRAEMIYNQSPRLSSGLALEVSLTRSINISAATTSSNTDTRIYRTEWRWSAHLLPSLTVTQNNQLEADYQQYPFSHSRDNLSLNYNTSTMLSAALPGGLSIDLQHNSTQSPRGSYTLQPDGLDALQLSDDSRNYALNASVRYAPFPAVGVHVEPRFQSSDRSGTVDGVQEKQRTDRRLDFMGGVDLNVHVGRKGMLTGHLSRAIQDQRTINYQNGRPQPTPRSETDFWSGNLQLTWTL